VDVVQKYLKCQPKAAEKISYTQFSDETAPCKQKTAFAAIQDAFEVADSQQILTFLAFID